MVLPGINFVAPIHEFSGYGEFARYFAASLHAAGLSVTVEPMTPRTNNLDFGENGKITQQLIAKPAVCNKQPINVVCFIATSFPKFAKPAQDKINIGFTMWEASRLPELWVQNCNQMDAIFVPSVWNQKVFKESGVTVPIHVVWPGVNGVHDKPKTTGEKYKFYSIFQWIERKNPAALLKAYWSAFAGHRDVALYLKTYRHGNVGNNDVFVNEAIAKVKGEIKIHGEFPEIQVQTKFASKAEVDRMHQLCDCFVLPTRAEGIGLPPMDAMSYGNPVIATNYSGLTDFLTSENSFPLDFHLTQVSNMNWYVPWFDASMYWAEPSGYQLAKYMRFVYENRAAATQVGVMGKRTIANDFQPAKSIAMFKEAIGAIVAKKE